MMSVIQESHPGCAHTGQSGTVAVVANIGWLVALVGLVMVLGYGLSRVTKRALRISDEAVNDPWFRRNDTSGLSLAIHWLRPGLVLLGIGLVVALVAETL